LGRCKFTAIRHSNVYGPYDKFDLERSHVYGAMVNKVLNANGTVQVWGTGKARRDLIYIDDLVSFVNAVLERQEKPYELFNCGSETAFSIESIIDCIMEVANKKNLVIVYDRTKQDIPTTVIVDCTKAHELLGWKRTHSLMDGTVKTINWVLQNNVV
jgi:GDP-L-fucose synthase